MIRRLILAALAAGLVAAPALAAPPTKPELLQKANEAANVCARHMPDSIATSAALKKAGFQLKESDGRLKFYSASGFRVVTAINTASGAEPVCLILVSKMTPAEANGLIQPWLKATGASQLDQNERRTRYIGALAGAPVIVGVVNEMDMNIVRGAAILVGAPR